MVYALVTCNACRNPFLTLKMKQNHILKEKNVFYISSLREKTMILRVQRCREIRRKSFFFLSGFASDRITFKMHAKNVVSRTGRSVNVFISFTCSIYPTKVRPATRSLHMGINERGLGEISPVQKTFEAPPNEI